MSFFKKKEDTGQSFQFHFSKQKFSTSSTPTKSVRNTFPIKVTVPEKRIKLSKETQLEEKVEKQSTSTPTTPNMIPKQESSLLSTLQSAVEQKLEKEQEQRKDVMDIVINQATPLSKEQEEQNEHFDSTVSDIHQFSKGWVDYCNDTIETLLDVEVELVCLENKLLFCCDRTIDKQIEEFSKSMDLFHNINGIVEFTKKKEADSQNHN